MANIRWALAANHAPIATESNVGNLRVRYGKVPVELNGTLYRNGPNPMFPPLGKTHHWFLGEGMVHAISINNGRVSYANRWVATEQYTDQKTAGRRLAPTSFEEMGDPTTRRPDVANTNVLYHGGRLIVLAEMMKPTLLERSTLETFGKFDFDGSYKGPMTAHPKVDPKTGELHSFGYMVDGLGTRKISYSVIDRHGDLVRHDTFEPPYCSMVHDFIVTDEHVLFPIFPATIDPERAKAGGSLREFRPDLPSYYGIVARGADLDTMRWFKGPACFVYHVLNGYTARSNGRTQVVADVFKFDGLPLFPDASGEADWIEFGKGKLVRWTFDLDSAGDSFKEEVLSKVDGEFPRLDERFSGARYRHAFYVHRSGDLYPGCSFDTLVHLDIETREHRTNSLPPTGGFLEPVFVSRSSGSPEGDGWILTIAYDADRDLSDLLVYEALDISAGPVAVVELPNRVPYGFHGNWAPA